MFYVSFYNFSYFFELLEIRVVLVDWFVIVWKLKGVKVCWIDIWIWDFVVERIVFVIVLVK